MTNDPKDKPGRAVPSRRLSRLAGLGGMAANIAGGIAVSGVKQLAAGKRPKAADLFMTPSNARKLTKQLSNMRGAAMKIGQMISMDSSDFLPREFADILARLRADAQHMPGRQLQQVLSAEWGADWIKKFESFQVRPIAAASIGQVQRAVLPSGEELAIKVQYPGVRESIDSDVNNVSALLRLSGLVPPEMDVKPVIEEGRRQLHQEADYLREAEYLNRFREILAEDPNFQVPEIYPELSTDKVLTMSFIKSLPIEEMIDAPQAARDRIVSLLMSLTLRELFEFKLMQTDPNFANYRFNEDTEQIVLLDFGASREIENELSDDYRALIQTTLSGKPERVYAQMKDMGFIGKAIPEETREIILEMISLAVEPLSRDAVFDFGENPMAVDLRDKGFALAGDKALWHVPPPATVFIQRKLGGIFMLASRLRAKINIAALVKAHIEH